MVKAYVAINCCKTAQYMYTNIPMLTHPQQGYGTEKLALGMRFLIVRISPLDVLMLHHNI